MLRTRVASAFVLIVLVTGPASAGGLVFLGLVALIGILATWEYAGLLRQGGYQPILPLGILLTLLLIGQGQWPDALPLDALLAAAVILSAVASLWHNRPKPATDWALTLAGSLYLGWLLEHFVRLRALESGLFWLLLAVAANSLADAAAYFVGRAIGRHRWWPRHSPKKTWEGYLGGALAAMLTTAILGAWLLEMNPLAGVSLGLLIGLLAPLGDLFESMIKRQVGAKDASQLIPGHGGVLDRIDSLLITVPLVFYWASGLFR